VALPPDCSRRRWLELSVPLEDNCPGIPDVEPPRLRLINNAVRDGWNLERLDTPLHWGTHLDAPYHLGLPRTLDTYAPEELQGPAVAVDCFGCGAGTVVGEEWLRRVEEAIRPGVVVLLCAGWWAKRAWSAEWVEGAPRLDVGGARFLAARGIRGVGVEGFSVGGRAPDNAEIHRALLSQGIWIAEGLRLERDLLPPARWQVLAFPLLVRRSSGAPARVVAVEAAVE
jgi:kynurenine formamidase